jgi:hypothetical protein
MERRSFHRFHNFIISFHNFQVEKVLKTRKRPGHPKEHLVRWAGYSEKFDSWVPATDIVIP